MSVKYKVLPANNPQYITASEKFYAAAIGDGNINLEWSSSCQSMEFAS